MNGPPKAAGDAAHRATQAALPWLLNGTLAGAEMEAAQAHLQACTACQSDLATLRRLREAGAAPDPHCDRERALARLMARIDTLDSSSVDAARPDLSGPPAPRPARPDAANDPRWLRRAAIAQCGVIVVLAVLLAWPAGRGDAYRGLGAAPTSQGEVVVMFRPDTPERELRRIVRASGARIIAGPTVTDAWVLAMPQAQSASLLARLRAEPAVLLAEPLGSERPPCSVPAWRRLCAWPPSAFTPARRRKARRRRPAPSCARARPPRTGYW